MKGHLGTFSGIVTCLALLLGGLYAERPYRAWLFAHSGLYLSILIGEVVAQHWGMDLLLAAILRRDVYRTILAGITTLLAYRLWRDFDA